MKGMGMRKAMGYNMSSITNSPVNGLLYVRGKISAQHASNLFETLHLSAPDFTCGVRALMCAAICDLVSA